jgi:hypothetical protein
MRGGGGALAHFTDLALRLEAGGLDAAVVDGWASAGYRERHPVPVLRLSARSLPGEHQVGILLSVDPASNVPERDRARAANASNFR